MLKSSNVTAIIVTYKSAAVIEACVKALRDQAIHVIVVDNDSGDSCADKAKLAGALVTVSSENLGFGVANNLGAKLAKTDWLLFINPDACACSGAIDALLQGAHAYPDAGMFGPRIIERSNRVFFQAQSLLATRLHNPKGILHEPNGDCCVPKISGACMFMRRDFFQSLGGFDPNIFLFYEDDDLCRRTTDLDRAIIWVNNAEVHHMRGKSTAQSHRSTFITRANLAWSRGYVGRKYEVKTNMVRNLAIHLVKLCAATLTLNLPRMARYGGTCMGAWRSLRRQSHPA